MAFAFGPHMCLGMHLARMETTVAINAVLDRLPNLRLDPDAEDVHITGLAFRAPRLPVLFDSTACVCPSSLTTQTHRQSRRGAWGCRRGSRCFVGVAEVVAGDEVADAVRERALGVREVRRRDDAVGAERVDDVAHGAAPPSRPR